MGNIAIESNNLGKNYHIGHVINQQRTLRDEIFNAFTAPFKRVGKLLRGQASGAADLDDIYIALKNVSFQIEYGEIVGIIGRNGAGKSTLLKILSRITAPTTGSATIFGRVGSLLEVGTGFHQELTGRENVFLNGAILGMNRAEVVRKFDEIVDFAGIDKFIDTPVKHYSSGMTLRLAFAVAAHLEPEILIVDEVLAVGDVAFQKKCMGKMGEVSNQGRTVLLVSHNMGAIAQLCERVLWLDDGQLRLDGKSDTVISSYLSSTVGELSCAWVNENSDPNDNKLKIKSAHLLSIENNPSIVANFNEALKLQIAYNVIISLRSLSIIYRVTDSQGNIIWTSWDTDTVGWNQEHVRQPGQYHSIAIIPAKKLKPNLYYISVSAYCKDFKFQMYENILSFQISEIGYKLNPGRKGLIAPPEIEWEMKKVNERLVSNY